MRAAKDREEEFNDPARKDNILGSNTTRLELWEKHLEDPIVALDKALKCVGRSVLKLARGFVEARQQLHAIGVVSDLVPPL